MISFITAVYNNTKYLRTCVESVTNQEYKDIEYIIVDDGSTDGTSELCDLLAAEDERIKVIHQKNQWIYASFNNGIMQASGEYIYILNSDDTLCPGSLIKMAEIVEKYNPDVVLTKLGIYECDENQNVLSELFLYSKNDEFDDRLIDRNEYIENFEKLFTADGLANQANLYKRELLLRHPFRTDWYGADVLVNLSLADEIHSLYVIRDAVYNFYRYNSSKGNASVNKWYNYEFEMQNEIKIKEYELLLKWGKLQDPDGEKRRHLEMKTISQVINVMDGMTGMTTEEKIKNIMTAIKDTSFIKKRLEDSREEIEARILSGLRKIMLNGVIDNTSEYYFVYELLEALLRYEKDEKDFEVIHNAVNHELNPCKVGYCFERKLIV